MTRCVYLYPDNGVLRVMPFEMGDQNQQWKRDVDECYIRSRQDHYRVLDIYGQYIVY